VCGYPARVAQRDAWGVRARRSFALNSPINFQDTDASYGDLTVRGVAGGRHGLPLREQDAPGRDREMERAGDPRLRAKR